MDYDCIIIGGGLSGLAAGIRLAHFGKKVCICEKHSRIGGLNSFYFKDGIEIDSGLHAMTNFATRKDHKSLPLLRLLRQLRIDYDALELREQNGSKISFPDITLNFSNEFQLLESEIDRNFPSEMDRFRKLDSFIRDFNGFDLSSQYVSAREIVSGYINSPLLIEMLFCPLMYYGSAVENDMDFSQFVIMYKSIFHEGFCKPAGGIRPLLNLLKERFEECGGELRRNCEVRRIKTKNGRVSALELADGELLTADRILSSAGYIETLRLCQPQPEELSEIPEGKLAFVETVAILDRKPEEYDSSIIFFNDSKIFHYERPSTAVDHRSGVICCPNNFRFNDSDPEHVNAIRITSLADYKLWNSADESTYSRMKEEAAALSIGIAEQLTGSELRNNIKLIDVFTPRTITRFTGHVNGALYGCPVKIKDAHTHLENLFLCGTDQGFLGITGSMLSGISIANLHALN